MLLRTLLSILPLTIVQTSPLPATTPAPASRFEFRENAAIDLWFHVRAVAAGEGTSPVAELAPAVAVLRELARELGPMSLRWGALEGLLPRCTGLADLARVFERAPETIEERGRTIELRARALAVAATLVAAEPACSELLAEHAYRTGMARAYWEEAVGAREPELLAFHQRRLGMETLALSIPVYLTAQGAPPGAVTYFDDDGKGVCFVAVDAVEGTLFLETVLHEATHALDIGAGRDSLFSELRDALGAAGFDENSRPFHDLPHLLMFLQSAESVRSVLASEHEDYGVARGVYARLGPRSAALRARFAAYSAGELARTELVSAFVALAK